jgi:hypothetical protein
MTEKQGDDSRSAAEKLSLADRREERNDLWEALNKALNTLMVGHAAGLVTCLTLLKDYKDKGLGWFIVLFGIGLIIAAFSVLAWTVGRADYVVFPRGKRFIIPQPQLFWTTAAFALLSTVLMAAAILIAIFKFGTL